MGKNKGEGKRRKGKDEGFVGNEEKYMICRGECERIRR
jgi:hypothetical protein